MMKPNGLTNGEWINLGHFSGFHPHSETYKCNYCGYEQYTVYMVPPSHCPRCGTRMKNGRRESGLIEDNEIKLL